MVETTATHAGDRLYRIQQQAVEQGRSPIAHWGPDPAKYVGWSSHSNRLIPVYTFGTRNGHTGERLADYTGTHSAYRDRSRLEDLYGELPRQTLHADANYLDQTDIAALQRAAFENGKTNVILVVFDGMDWFSTWAAAIYKRGRVAYREGRGNGLVFQDYTADGTTEFGWMVTSPAFAGARVDVDRQAVLQPTPPRGGYAPRWGGYFPWSLPRDPDYLIPSHDAAFAADALRRGFPVHAYTDSASSATSMTSGAKTYNGAINIAPDGSKLKTIAHWAQQQGKAVGIVTSVPISHATPAAAYAHNVSRGDYQDISRDLLGLPSASHPHKPLPGVDVLIGAGFGAASAHDAKQGRNYQSGNRYLADADLRAADVRYGGHYEVALRTPGRSGREVLETAVHAAVKRHHRLLGFFGVASGHLPYRTGNGDFQPAPDKNGKSEHYSRKDLDENPTLADMTAAALEVLQHDPDGFWLMVEAGDVDWASHSNNLDSAIGAVLSGEAAVQVIFRWVERHGGWQRNTVIVTSDHGHLLFLDDPEALADAGRSDATQGR
ncbi:MAG: alkaline phosphatase [Planctomycetota bacterium]|nr:MAG: alkaline phosphatase [Planctomycetota bacterium]